jgi:hydrogenase maturation factor
MRLGPEALEVLKAQIHGQLQKGDTLVAAGVAGLAVTGELLAREAEYFEKRFSPSFLRDAEALKERYGISEERFRELVNGESLHGWAEAGEDGVLAALWKLAEASGVGLHADLRRIPIRQETIEICECFDKNPYQAPSGGMILAGFSDAAPFLEVCQSAGIPAAVIGRTNGENARLLYSGESVRYLDRPRPEKEKTLS